MSFSIRHQFLEMICSIWTPSLMPHATKLLIGDAFSCMFGLLLSLGMPPLYFLNLPVTKRWWSVQIITFLLLINIKAETFANLANRCWFMQNGTTPHTSNATFDLMKTIFMKRFVSSGCDFDWTLQNKAKPLHSPDLNPP